MTEPRKKKAKKKAPVVLFQFGTVVCVGCDGAGWEEGTDRKTCVICAGSGKVLRQIV